LRGCQCWSRVVLLDGGLRLDLQLGDLGASGHRHHGGDTAGEVCGLTHAWVASESVAHPVVDDRLGGGRVELGAHLGHDGSGTDHAEPYPGALELLAGMVRHVHDHGLGVDLRAGDVGTRCGTCVATYYVGTASSV